MKCIYIALFSSLIYSCSYENEVEQNSDEIVEHTPAVSIIKPNEIDSAFTFPLIDTSLTHEVYKFHSSTVKYYKLSDSTEFMDYESWNEERLMYFKESYGLIHGELVYAFESEMQYDEDRTFAKEWNCKYRLKNGNVLKYISSGHGETETDSWEPDSIFKQWEANVKLKYDFITNSDELSVPEK